MHSTYSVGQQLKNARQARHLTIEQVTEATHIRARFIEAMEDDDFEALPSPVQARGFLRLYTDFLGLSLDGLIAVQRGVNAEPQTESAPAEMKAEEAPTTTKVEAEPEPEPELEPGEYVPPEPRPSTPARDIFLTIGANLRQRRESLGLTLEEVARHTHVRKHYLQALETGDFDHLPTSVQARGMLNNYAHFLDLQVDDILLRFAEGLQAQRLERQHPPLANGRRAASARQTQRATPGASIRRFLSLDLIFGGGLILILIFFAIWGTNQVLGRRAASQPQATAPSISDVLLVSPQPGVGTSQAGQISEMITPSLPSLPTSEAAYPTMTAGHVQVIVIGLERTWVRVTVDGKIKLEGRILAGSAYPFEGNGRIEVLTGDGSAVQIIYNTTNLGVMGTYGEVVDLIYTPQDVLKPTQTPLPTATATPRTTPTATRTLTPQPSRTPTAKP